MQRRCIHDAFGNEDPEKVKQSAIPRPHARKSNVHGKDGVIKKPQRLPRQIDSDCANPDPHPQVVETFVSQLAPVANMVAHPSLSESILANSPAVSDAATQRDVAERASLLLDPALFWETTVQTSVQGQAQHSTTFSTLRKSANDSQPNSTTDGHRSLETPHASSDTKVDPESLDQRESFEQPASSLVSPPASSYDEIGNSLTTANPHWVPSRSSSEQSSTQFKQSQHRYTPESGPLRRASSSSYSEATSEQAAGSKSAEMGSIPKARAGFQSEYRADEESLRLIKELQAQEMGLRKRGNL